MFSHATLRFVEQDLTIPARERALFSPPAPKRAEEVELPLYNLRAAAELAKGAEGLDVQGFTCINHISSLTRDELLQGTNVEDVYAPEVRDMMLRLTGAKRGVVHSIGFRKKPSTETADPSYVMMRGAAIDKILDFLPQDDILVTGRSDPGSEPARQAHVDMTYEGMRRTIRLAQPRIRDAARAIIEAEDLRIAGHPVRVPRYAGYSVWKRPLKTVKRDPLAVLDWRTLDKSEIIPSENRIPSGITEEKDYIIEAYTALPPKRPEAQRWYWVPEQTPEEVLVVKFADSASQEDPQIASCCVHASPIVPGTEHEETRESCETRMYLFWD